MTISFPTIEAEAGNSRDILLHHGRNWNMSTMVRNFRPSHPVCTLQIAEDNYGLSLLQLRLNMVFFSQLWLLRPTICNYEIQWNTTQWFFGTHGLKVLGGVLGGCRSFCCDPNWINPRCFRYIFPAWILGDKRYLVIFSSAWSSWTCETQLAPCNHKNHGVIGAQETWMTDMLGAPKLQNPPDMLICCW